MKLRPGVVIAGKYRIERQLAVGGMGSLWVARHVQLDVAVALKVMDATHAASSVSRARFEREAKASASLRNRHVVHVQDYGLEGDMPYLVMELLQGEDLGKRLSKVKRLQLEPAARVLTQIAKGLRPAHEARLVHRDLKPANIFLAKGDDEDEEVVKVLDFGIAKDMLGAAVGENTKTGELMGSPHYMSPEQIRGAKDIDPRSDLWSLSVIMFRCLSGQLPFKSEQLGAVIAQILTDPVPVITAVAPDLDADLDGFFARGFARDPAKRFQSAREMADAFAALALGPARRDATMRWTLAPGSLPAAALPTPAPSTPPPAPRADHTVAGLQPPADVPRVVMPSPGGPRPRTKTLDPARYTPGPPPSPRAPVIEAAPVYSPVGQVQVLTAPGPEPAAVARSEAEISTTGTSFADALSGPTRPVPVAPASLTAPSAQLAGPVAQPAVPSSQPALPPSPEPMRPSFASIPDSMRPALASIPDSSRYTPGAPLSDGAVQSATGGPVIQTTRPPAPGRTRISPLAIAVGGLAVFCVVGIGVLVLTAGRGPEGGPKAATSPATVTAAPPEKAPATAAEPAVSPSTSAPPPAESAAGPPPSASATAKPPAAAVEPALKPLKSLATAAPAPAAKKKPSWGF